VEATVERCWTHVERVGAEARLREGEAQQGFLLRLSDAIRPLHDAGKVQAEACRRLGEHLGVAQVGFGEIGPSQDFVTIHCDWNSGRLPSILGTWRMDDFGPDFIADIRRGETAVIPDVARDPRTDAPEVLAAYARIGIRAVLDVPLIKGGRMVAVLFIHHPEPRSWSRADVSLVEEASVRLWEAVERSRAEAALRESERRLGAALAAARLGSFEWNRATDAMALDGRSREIFGFAESEGLCGEELFARIHPDDLPRVRGEVQASADTLTRLVTEYRILPPGGGVRFLASLADAHADASGRAVRLVGLFADVTERRAAEERQILLSREVDHRAKNALAVVQSVVQLTESRDPVAFKRAVLGRISALSRAQTLLADESWSGADLRTLLMGELEPFLGDREIEVEGPPAVLPPGAAQPMAMAFHELATNAVKYGALSIREGRLSVVWRLVPGPDGFPLLRFRWAEAGGPPIAAAPERRGFGSRVLDGTLRRQLGGSMVQRWEPSGLVCTIEVPLTPVVQDAAAGGEGAAR
jgi:PAS domain S-box-containing protein